MFVGMCTCVNVQMYQARCKSVQLSVYLCSIDHLVLYVWCICLQICLHICLIVFGTRNFTHRSCVAKATRTLSILGDASLQTSDPNRRPLGPFPGSSPLALGYLGAIPERSTTMIGVSTANWEHSQWDAKDKLLTRSAHAISMFIMSRLGALPNFEAFGLKMIQVQPACPLPNPWISLAGTCQSCVRPPLWVVDVKPWTTRTAWSTVNH